MIKILQYILLDRSNQEFFTRLRFTVVNSKNESEIEADRQRRPNILNSVGATDPSVKKYAYLKTWTILILVLMDGLRPIVGLLEQKRWVFYASTLYFLVVSR